jgi:hypothetical protein
MHLQLHIAHSGKCHTDHETARWYFASYRTRIVVEVKNIGQKATVKNRFQIA